MRYFLVLYEDDVFDTLITSNRKNFEVKNRSLDFCLYYFRNNNDFDSFRRYLIDRGCTELEVN